MLAEVNGSLEETERARVTINHEVVRLLQEKTVPLNRARYLHLQKISRAVCKETPILYASSAQLTLNFHPLTLHSLPKHPRHSSTRNSPMAAADLLLHRLNAIKTKETESQEDSGEDLTRFNLRGRILQTEVPMPLHREKAFTKTPKSQGRRKQEILLELAEKAESYLRVKKRDLKERHSKQHHLHDQKRGVQCLITPCKLQKGKHGNMNNKMLQRELMRDFQESMLEQKMNRMKREINHRKMVQLR